MLAASKLPLRYAVAGLCLMAQLLGLVHLALVQHATCLEHDALVHAEGGQTPGPAPLSRTVPWLERLGPESAGHADDHCLAAGFRRLDLANLRADFGVLAGPPPVPIHPGWRDRVEPPAPVALLRLAPKSSPPAPPV